MLQGVESKRWRRLTWKAPSLGSSARWARGTVPVEQSGRGVEENMLANDSSEELK